MSSKKPTFDKYQEWLHESFGITIPKNYNGYYDIVVAKMKSDFEKSVFWTMFLKDLRNYNDIYLQDTNYQLIKNFEPTIHTKPYDSFLQKTYRKNILENKYWPNHPAKEWLLPDNWFSKINDLVRTLIEVKYLDGVEFLIERTEELCHNLEIDFESHLEARDEGYYAAHVYIPGSFEIPMLTWDTELVETKVEIQITTQLQEVIRQLLHEYYEEKRVTTGYNEKWKWAYKSNEFAANYLGHILHYLEGIIVEVRDRHQKKENTS